MAHNILLTGVTGYLGGTLLNRYGGANLPSSGKTYALVRNAQQAEKVHQYGVLPLILDVTDGTSVTNAIVEKDINVIFFLIDAFKADSQEIMIRALGQVRERTGRDVHFLHTTGAKLFSSHVGHPSDTPLLDTDPKLYTYQKTLQGPLERMNKAKEANNKVIETCKANGVRSYIFAPCMVYGEGEGFGNRISIQTVAIVKAAKALRQMYRVQPGNPTWPVCHVVDNTTLYLAILRQILEGKDPGQAEQGYYLASSGHIAWEDLYSAFAKALAKRGAVNDESVKVANEEILEKMGQALGCPKEAVPAQLSGTCTFTAEHGKQIGWSPQYAARHILEAADAEVELILKHI